jgi:hypothetical protein
MSSTTPKTKAASPGVNTPSKIQKQPGGGGTPAPNAFGGFQEPVPDAVFMSTAGTPDFLASAKKFYTYFGLQPKDIKSIEDLVLLLADPSNTTIYKRLLIVSHAHPRGMIIPFFTKGVVGTNKEVFRGFAVDDLEGLKVLDPFHPKVFNWNSVIASIMSNIRSNPAHANALDPFGLKTSGLPGPQLTPFFEECLNFVFVNTPGHVKDINGNVITTPQRKTFAAFVKELASQRRKKLANTTVDGHPATDSQLQALQDMLTALPLSDLNAGSVYTMTDFAPGNVNYFPTLDNAVRAVQNGFHDKVVQMRKRFTPTSAIDIRGCRAGDDADYLLAIREFFDKPGTPDLKASAPRWFQSYPPLAWERPANRHEVSTFVSGKIFLNTVAHDEQLTKAKAWAALIKIDPLHTDFWTTLFEGTPANFLTLTWRNSIPPLFIPTPGLAALQPLSLGDLVSKLADMFNVPAGSVPNASQIASKDSAAFQTFMNEAKQSLESGDGIYYYMLFAGLPIFFFNKNQFINHEGLLVLKSFDKNAMQSWYKCMWAGALPSNASNDSTNATLDKEISRRVPMLQDDHAATEWAICPATEYGDRIQTSP